MHSLLVDLSPLSARLVQYFQLGNNVLASASYAALTGLNALLLLQWALHRLVYKFPSPIRYILTPCKLVSSVGPRLPVDCSLLRLLLECTLFFLTPVAPVALVGP